MFGSGQWRVVVAALGLGGGLIGSAYVVPASQQSGIEGRVAALETRVTQLERTTIVAPIAASGRTIVGVVELFDADRYWSGVGPCFGYGGYSDLKQGAEVVAMDGAGEILAIGRLDAGVVVATHRCRFTFRIEGVPDADFYRLSVANRAAPSYSRDELEALGWRIELSIGG